MKKETKSLIIYTSLIFVISIAMILIAFVGQNNSQSMQPQTDVSGEGIPDKINKLSDENRLLLQEKSNLQDIILDIEKENGLLYNFLKINALIEEGRLEQAETDYKTIAQTFNPEELTELQRAYYDDIAGKLELARKIEGDDALYKLMKLEVLINNKNYEEARKIHKSIDTLTLTNIQKSYYDSITRTLEEALEEEN